MLMVLTQASSVKGNVTHLSSILNPLLHILYSIPAELTLNTGTVGYVLQICLI